MVQRNAGGLPCDHREPGAVVLAGSGLCPAVPVDRRPDERTSLLRRRVARPAAGDLWTRDRHHIALARLRGATAARTAAATAGTGTTRGGFGSRRGLGRRRDLGSLKCLQVRELGEDVLLSRGELSLLRRLLFDEHVEGGLLGLVLADEYVRGRDRVALALVDRRKHAQLVDHVAG